MNRENHCTYKGKECNQILDEGYGEKTVWWHIKGLTCNDPKKPGYIETGGRPGSYLFCHFTPKEIVKSQAEKKLMSLISICIQCKVRIRSILRMQNEVESL